MLPLLALVHGAVLATVPSAPLVAIGVWWNSNTISHNFIHRPFFRSRAINAIFAGYLSVLLGIPQAWWRSRHLAHHGLTAARPLHRGELALHVALVIASWGVMIEYWPVFFASTYLPGYACGLLLCSLHGHYEHAHGAISHYGTAYNLLCFNDGYHVEHHRHPGVSWQRLPAYRVGAATTSAWPAPLRWMEVFSLTTLERLVLRSRLLQRFVVTVHARAFRAVTSSATAPARIAIVGGGLFPRTAIVLRSLFPDSELTIVDANCDHLKQARAWLSDPRVVFEHARFSGEDNGRFDAIVVPLAYQGDRDRLYAAPPASTTIVHDWIWRKRGNSRVVSRLLLKRINVIVR